MKIEAEFISVLSYPKFGLKPVEILPIVNQLRKHIELIEIKSRISIIKEDPTDNIFLECALDGKVNYIISGDHHLLKLTIFEGIQKLLNRMVP